MASGEWVPLFIAIGFIILVPSFINLMVESVYAFPEYDSNSVIEPVLDFWENGFSIFTISFNPFSIFPDFLEDYVSDSLEAFTYIPNYLTIPILLIMFSGLFWAIWRAVVV